MERRGRVAKVRLIRLKVLLLVSIAAGCASTRTEPESANFVQPHEVTTEDACGTPFRWPLSRECVNTLSLGLNQAQIALLQHKSDLMMAVWRACPSADPCKAVSDATPACHPLTDTDQSLKACREAHEADYSCRALENDPIYAQENRAVGNCLNKCPSAQVSVIGGCFDRCLDLEYPGRAECSQAQTNLADFQDRVQKAMLDAQLKAAFAPPEPIFFPPSPQPPVIIQPPQPPVIIQQQAAPLAPLPGPPVFTHCTNLGLTTNCITH